MTYSFNFLENYSDHHVFSGTVVLDEKGEPATDAEITFDCGSEQTIVYAGSHGQFWKILSKENCPEVRTAMIQYRSHQGAVTHGHIWSGDRIPPPGNIWKLQPLLKGAS